MRQADLAHPLDFAENGEFDVVICPLVLHYLRDWQPALDEFRRILKPKAIFVFSTHHPFMDWKLFGTENYFAVESLEDEWKGVGKVRFYRRPLTVISEALYAAGFFIERLLEPLPTEDFLRLNPEGYVRLTKNPLFLVVRAARKE